MAYANHPSLASAIANRFLSPTWEVTNTFLVFLVVAVVGLFPLAAFSLGMVLLIPVSLVLLLIALRGSFMVFAFTVKRFPRTLRYVSGLTGLLVPPLMVSVLPVTQGGFLAEEGGETKLLLGKLFTSPSVYCYMLLGLFSTLFLSALFLSDFSRELGKEDAYRIYRRNALVTGPLALLSAVVSLAVFEPEAGWLLQNLSRYILWFAASIACFVVGYAALWWPDDKKGTVGRPRVAMVAVALQYAIASFAYGAAHLPYIVYQSVTVGDSFVGPATFYVLLILYGCGIAVLLPGFLLFWRLFLKNRGFA
jgi:cytochrome d ubiquinol oxidase subunit II